MATSMVGESLHQLIHCYKRELSRAREEAEIGLSFSHIGTLKSFGALLDRTPQRIVARMLLDKAPVTRAISELVAGVLVKNKGMLQINAAPLLSLHR